MLHVHTIDVNAVPDSLHVTVMKVKRESKARTVGVHTQMYLKSLSLGSNSDTFGSPIFIKGDICRHKPRSRSLWETTGDIWREPDDIPVQGNPVDLSSLIELVVNYSIFTEQSIESRYGIIQILVLETM